MKFKTKIGWWFHLTMLVIIAIGCAMPLALGIQYDSTSTLVVGAIMSVITLVVILPMYLNTYYVLENETLHIRCGFIVNMRIPYKDITMIYETKDPSASIGLSLDRISINYSKGEVLISPRNKQEFMRLLNEYIEK